MLLLVVLSFISAAVAVQICNVLDYGAVADNSTDVGPAITSAYVHCVAQAVTTDPSDTVLLVPSGDFLLASNVAFSKPKYFTLTITGNLYMPFDPSLKGTMLQWNYGHHIAVNGTGAIYGNGYRYREGGNLALYPDRPRLIRFQNCDSCEITGVTLYDSPMFHVSILGNNNIAHDMKIIASHIGGTDGFDMYGDNNYVHDVYVENGDECVTVKSPTDGFVAENIVCNYTTGCNIGSFGSGLTGYSVRNVTYTNVTVLNSAAGVMIKSYPDCVGSITNLRYNNFKLTDVAYPIDINMYWCGTNNPASCPHKGDGAQTITDVQFNDFVGTGSIIRPYINLNCLSNTPCTDIEFTNISISGTKPPSIKFACGVGISEMSTCVE